MEPVTVSILGLGAEGSIAFRALAGKPCRVRILAKGERAQRLRAEGITINGTHYDLTVSEPGAEPPPKLLIVAVKSYQLSGALEDAAAECGQNTVVMSLMNGLTSEEVLARRIGGDHLIYCMSRINAKKSGPNVEFQPVGAIYIGEKDGSVTDRIREIHALLDGDVSCCISREILLDIWRKYMFNAAFNTVESILRCRHRWFQQLPEANAALECVIGGDRPAGQRLRRDAVGGGHPGAGRILPALSRRRIVQHGPGPAGPAAHGDRHADR